MQIMWPCIVTNKVVQVQEMAKTDQNPYLKCKLDLFMKSGIIQLSCELIFWTKIFLLFQTSKKVKLTCYAFILVILVKTKVQWKSIFCAFSTNISPVRQATKCTETALESSWPVLHILFRKKVSKMYSLLQKFGLYLFDNF